MGVIEATEALSLPKELLSQATEAICREREVISRRQRAIHVPVRATGAEEEEQMGSPPLIEKEEGLVGSQARALLELLAALEHEQWAHWTRYMLGNLNPANIERWTRQCATPYEELSEPEKESDREWARKVMGILREYGGSDQGYGELSDQACAVAARQLLGANS